jgi:glutamate synthase domain-containing protein 1
MRAAFAAPASVSAAIRPSAGDTRSRPGWPTAAREGAAPDHDACGVGFVADLDGRHAYRTVPIAFEALAALAHRGARAADDRTGDSASVSIPISRRFAERIVSESGLSSRPAGRLALAMCFLPIDADAAMRTVERCVASEG